MNINYIRDKIFEQINIKHLFIYKGNRNQVEKFEGEIVKCYSRIFIIKLLNGTIKTFSYNDFIIGNLYYVL